MLQSSGLYPHEAHARNHLYWAMTYPGSPDLASSAALQIVEHVYRPIYEARIAAARIIQRFWRGETRKLVGVRVHWAHWPNDPVHRRPGSERLLPTDVYLPIHHLPWHLLTLAREIVNTYYFQYRRMSLVNTQQWMVRIGRWYTNTNAPFVDYNYYGHRVPRPRHINHGLGNRLQVDLAPQRGFLPGVQNPFDALMLQLQVLGDLPASLDNDNMEHVIESGDYRNLGAVGRDARRRRARNDFGTWTPTRRWRPRQFY